MNIKDFAQIVLGKNDPAYMKKAVDNLKIGLDTDTQWTEVHKGEVRALVAFLEAGETNVDNLANYYS